MIERSTKTLAQLIDDLLDASRIIAGKLTFETRPLELRPVIEAAFDAASPAAEAKGILLERSLPGPLPPVAGDPGRLQQVVGNLLANAVKFTPEGGQVEVRLARSGSTAHVTITDTGSGISPEFLPFIFERFRQADTTSTRKQKGLGLGLAIARQIVELHGGTIEASSAGEGRGSTFTVKLPLLVSTSPVVLPAARGEERPGRTPALDGITVLVVDDEEDAREAMAVLLGQAGARVISVGGAAEAIDTLDRERPDVLLSDIAMPGEDGYALIRRVRLRSGETGGRIPAAALTAYATLRIARRRFAPGTTSIPKPVDPTRSSAPWPFSSTPTARPRPTRAESGRPHPKQGGSLRRLREGASSSVRVAHPTQDEDEDGSGTGARSDRDRRPRARRGNGVPYAAGVSRRVRPPVPGRPERAGSDEPVGAPGCGVGRARRGACAAARRAGGLPFVRQGWVRRRPVT